MTGGMAEILQGAGLATDTLDVWIEQAWLRPEQTAGGAIFSDRDFARARFIVELRGKLGVNDEGIGVILHLLDQLNGVRLALAQLRDDLPPARS